MFLFIKFTDLINESSRYDEMGVGSISNKDNANPKQLKWEMKRNDSERKPYKRLINKKSKVFKKTKKNVSSKKHKGAYRKVSLFLF